MTLHSRVEIKKQYSLQLVTNLKCVKILYLLMFYIILVIKKKPHQKSANYKYFFNANGTFFTKKQFQ